MDNLKKGLGGILKSFLFGDIRTVDDAILAIERAGYLPVEPVQLEVLGDEERHTTLLDGEEMDEVLGQAKAGFDWIYIYIERIIKKASQITIAHNEAKFGKPYRVKEGKE